MKRLQNKNIVSLYEVIDDPTKDCFYLVQEYMDLGPVLSDNEHNQCLKPDVVRKYLVDVLYGLEYLHFQGVVHRYATLDFGLLGTNVRHSFADSIELTA
jgi:serine/threonine protein kinase